MSLHILENSLLSSWQRKWITELAQSLLTLHVWALSLNGFSDMCSKQTYLCYLKSAPIAALFKCSFDLCVL